MANNKKQVFTLNENDFQINVAQDFKPPCTANTINCDQIIDFCALSYEDRERKTVCGHTKKTGLLIRECLHMSWHRCNGMPYGIWTMLFDLFSFVSLVKLANGMHTLEAPLFRIFVTIKQPLSTFISKLIDVEISQASQTHRS